MKNLVSDEKNFKDIIRDSLGVHCRSQNTGYSVFSISVMKRSCSSFLDSLNVYLILALADHAKCCCSSNPSVISNISNTRKSVSFDFHSPLSGLKKQGAADLFFNQLLGVWKSHETLFPVFDKASLTEIIVLREIQRKRSPNFMIINITFSNLLHGSDFLWFLFVTELLTNLRSSLH